MFAVVESGYWSVSHAARSCVWNAVRTCQPVEAGWEIPDVRAVAKRIGASAGSLSNVLALGYPIH